MKKVSYLMEDGTSVKGLVICTHKYADFKEEVILQDNGEYYTARTRYRQ